MHRAHILSAATREAELSFSQLQMTQSPILSAAVAPGFFFSCRRGHISILLIVEAPGSYSFRYRCRVLILSTADDPSSYSFSYRGTELLFFPLQRPELLLFQLQRHRAHTLSAAEEAELLFFQLQRPQATILSAAKIPNSNSFSCRGPALLQFQPFINNNKKLVLRHKCRCKLSSARFSATVRKGTKQMCFQHTLETQQKD